MDLREAFIADGQAAAGGAGCTALEEQGGEQAKRKGRPRRWWKLE